MRLVIAAAGAKRTRPAAAAVDLFVDVVLFEKRNLNQAIDAVAYGTEFVSVGTGETMAKRDIAVSGDAHQPQAGTAGISFTDPFMNLFERVFDVRESVMAILKRGPM